MTRKVPTHEEARAILSRFNASHWNNPGEHARYSIPARPDHDDDIQLAEYINTAEQQSARIAELEAENKAYWSTCGSLRDDVKQLEAERDAVRKALAFQVIDDGDESDGGGPVLTFSLDGVGRDGASIEAALLAAAREGGG